MRWIAALAGMLRGKRRRVTNAESLAALIASAKKGVTIASPAVTQRDATREDSELVFKFWKFIASQPNDIVVLAVQREDTGETIAATISVRGQEFANRLAKVAMEEFQGNGCTYAGIAVGPAKPPQDPKETVH